MSTKEMFKIDEKYNRICYIGMGIGLIALPFMFFSSHERFWTNILINAFFLITLCMSGFFFLSLQNVTNSSWMRPYQRVPQAMKSFLPWAFLITLLLGLGLHSLYEWTHTEMVMRDEILVQKIAYLNVPFFMGRLAFIFIGWILFSYLIDKKMAAFDRHAKDVQTPYQSLVRTSAISLVFFALSFATISYDLIMSLEPHWFSTIFSLYTFSGLFVSGVSFIALVLIILNSLGYFTETITENHLHDLGKWMFGMSTFWAYIWFSQYMLIWYSNIPEETQYFTLRNEHGWQVMFWANLIINWVIPFVVLLSRNAKRNKYILARVAVLLIVGHWFDLYLLVSPKVFEHAKIKPSIGLLDILIAIGFFSFFVLMFMKSLAKNKLVVEHDPYHEEGLHLNQ